MAHQSEITKPRKPRITFQDVVQEVAVLRALGAIEAVVSGHNGADAGQLHHHGKVLDIGFAKGLLVHHRVLGCATILDVVGSKVLGRGNHVLLNANGERRSHASDLIHVFAVRFLAPTPVRVPQDVHTRREQHVVQRTHDLVTHGLSDGYLVIDIP